MRPDFFIFSLPRSGSAWLSMFLSGRDSYCYHEPLADFTADAWIEQAQKRPEEIVGGVDTGAYRWPTLLTGLLPGAKLFVLVRNREEIKRSWNSLRFNALPENIMDAEVEKIRAISVGMERIYHAHLGDVSYLEDLWGRVIGTPFDRERALLLSEMRVTRDVPVFMGRRPWLAESQKIQSA